MDWTTHYDRSTEEDDSDYVKEADRAMWDLIDFEGDIYISEVDEVKICSRKVVEVARELEENDKNLKEFAGGDAPDVQVTAKDLAFVVFARVVSGRSFLESKEDQLDLEESEWIYLHDNINTY